MESIINTNSVTYKQEPREWSGPDITVLCADGQVIVKKDKLLAAGQYFSDCLEESEETVLDLSKLPPVKIPKALFDRVLEFTDLTKGFTPVIQKPLKHKTSMLQATTPALANFAESFGKYADGYESLA